MNHNTLIVATFGGAFFLASTTPFLGKHRGPLPDHVTADSILVEKSVHRMSLLKDGRVFSVDRFGRLWPIIEMYYPPCLYVHPVTGVLCRNEWRRSRRQQRRREQQAKARELAMRMRELEPYRQLHLLADGNWWDVRLEQVRYYTPYVDVIDRAQPEISIRGTQDDGHDQPDQHG